MLEFLNRNRLRGRLYFFGLSMLVIAMPLSKALLSLSLLFLIIAWVFSPNLKERIILLKNRKSIWITMLGFLLVVVGLFYSSNISRNLYLLGNIKIAFIILPLIIGTFEPLSKRDLRQLLILFTLSNIIASVVSTLIFFQVVRYAITDVRDISVFVESIRFALLLVINIALLLYAFYYNTERLTRVSISVIIVWFVFFLNILQALTGLVALLLTLLVVIIVFWKNIKRFWRYALIIIAGISAIIALIFANNVIAGFYTKHSMDLSKLDSLTVNGVPYLHNMNDSESVNGYLVNVYVCEPELRKEWAKVSDKSLDSLGLRKWGTVRNCLISYMSSKGLRKDSAGFAQLSERDIRYIEYGYTNAELAGLGLKARAYDVVREFDTWNRTGKPDGSITIRLNALVNGWKVIRQNIWFGTGYGDINDDIQAQFEEDAKVFGAEKRQNPHNQFFTVLIGSGIVGLIVFLFSLIMPGIIEKKYNSYLFLVSFCVVVLSFLSDDTLERMVGVVITAFFFSIFMYAIPEDLNN